MNYSSTFSGQYRYNFKGMEDDEETGLNHTHFRPYNPWLGRWLSVDPEWERFRGWSPYNSMNNNPLNLVDPLGNTVDDYKVNITTNEVEWVSDLGGDEVDFFNIVENNTGALGGELWIESYAVDKVDYNGNELVAFPDNGFNWGRYGNRDEGGDNWASPQMAGAFFGLLHDFGSTYPNDMVYFDDMSSSDLRDIGHITHRTGDDVDIRYIGANNTPNYDRSTAGANCVTCYNTLFEEQGHAFRAVNVEFIKRAALWGFNQNYAYPQNPRLQNTNRGAHYIHKDHLHIGIR